MLDVLVTLLEVLTVYFGWLSFPTIIACIYFIKCRYYFKTSILLLFLSVLFVWAHYIERYIILVKEHTIVGLGIKADVVLIADMHLGYYKDQYFLQRVVERINALPADYVVIAGDYLYKSNEGLENLLAPLAQLNKPVYTVRGNHDYRYLRTHLNEDLLIILEKYGVKFIESTIVDMGEYQLTGLGDRLEGSDNSDFLMGGADSNLKPLLVLAHNPDSVDRVLNYNTAIVLAAHTHCGQIRLPWLSRLVIRSNYKFTCGLEYFNSTPVFITPGIGENNLPLRLFNAPTINVLHLRP